MSKDKVILLSYYGAKNRIAGRYPPPVFDTIVEPFAGSAGYACRYPDKKVILFEKDPVVYSAVNYLIHASPDEVLTLPLLAPGDLVSDLPICDGARALISFWTNKGTARGSNRLSKWATEWPDNSFYWGARCRARAAYAASRIKHWKIYNMDYRQIDDSAILSGAPCTWFIDPPYAGKSGDHYTCCDVGDYAELARWCMSRPGQVIACENEGATWLPFQRLCGAAGAAKAGSARKRSTEVMWVKG